MVEAVPLTVTAVVEANGRMLAMLSPRRVVVDVRPTYTASSALKMVLDAFPNRWSPVHTFVFVRLSEATTAPVVGEMVSVPSAFETLETAPPPPPIQVLPIAKHPEVMLIPPPVE